jgi:hypothetical protein
MMDRTEARFAPAIIDYFANVTRGNPPASGSGREDGTVGLFVVVERSESAVFNCSDSTKGNPQAAVGIKAVQTLSRLNRARPQKHDTFVLASPDQ